MTLTLTPGHSFILETADGVRRNIKYTEGQRFVSSDGKEYITGYDDDTGFITALDDFGQLVQIPTRNDDSNSLPENVKTSNNNKTADLDVTVKESDAIKNGPDKSVEEEAPVAKSSKAQTRAADAVTLLKNSLNASRKIVTKKDNNSKNNGLSVADFNLQNAIDSHIDLMNRESSISGRLRGITSSGRITKLPKTLNEFAVTEPKAIVSPNSEDESLYETHSPLSKKLKSYASPPLPFSYGRSRDLGMFEEDVETDQPVSETRRTLEDLFKSLSVSEKQQYLFDMLDELPEKCFLRVVVPRLVSVVTLWQLLLLSCEHEAAGEPPTVRHILPMFEMLFTSVKTFLQSCVPPSNSDESDGKPRAMLNVQDLGLARLLGFDSSEMQMYDKPVHEFDPQAPLRNLLQKRASTILSRSKEVQTELNMEKMHELSNRPAHKKKSARSNESSTSSSVSAANKSNMTKLAHRNNKPKTISIDSITIQTEEGVSWQLKTLLEQGRVLGVTEDCGLVIQTPTNVLLRVPMDEKLMNAVNSYLAQKPTPGRGKSISQLPFINVQHQNGTSNNSPSHNPPRSLLPSVSETHEFSHDSLDQQLFALIPTDLPQYSSGYDVHNQQSLVVLPQDFIQIQQSVMQSEQMKISSNSVTPSSSDAKDAHVGSLSSLLQPVRYSEVGASTTSSFSLPGTISSLLPGDHSQTIASGTVDMLTVDTMDNSPRSMQQIPVSHHGGVITPGLQEIMDATNDDFLASLNDSCCSSSNALSSGIDGLELLVPPKMTDTIQI